MQRDLAAYNWGGIEEILSGILGFLEEVAQVAAPAPLELPDLAGGQAAGQGGPEAREPDPWAVAASETINRLIDVVAELAEKTSVELAVPDPLDPPEPREEQADEPAQERQQEARAKLEAALTAITDKINELVARQAEIVQIPTPERATDETGLREVLEDLLREVGRLGTITATGAFLDSGPMGIGIGVHEGREGPAAQLLPEVGTADTPAEILPEAFETEAAQEDTWSQAAPPAETDGVAVRLQTRMAYNDAGDEKLYGYYRTFTYDSCGKLLTISAETRVEVDEPGPCP